MVLPTLGANQESHYVSDVTNTKSKVVLMTMQYFQVILNYCETHDGTHEGKVKYTSTWFDFPRRDIPVSVKD